jgi:hypothetical protein
MYAFPNTIQQQRAMARSPAGHQTKIGEGTRTNHGRIVIIHNLKKKLMLLYIIYKRN